MRHRATPRRSGGCSVSGPSIWFVVLLTTAFGLLPSVGVAFGGQGQESSIVGQVKDESGSILPGVTVTATSPSLQVPQIDAVTKVLGEYRLAPLLIGNCEVTYSLSGFQTFSSIRTSRRVHLERPTRRSRPSRYRGRSGFRTDGSSRLPIRPPESTSRFQRPQPTIPTRSSTQPTIHGSGWGAFQARIGSTTVCSSRRTTTAGAERPRRVPFC
jgi:hypothetical protein